MKSKPDSDYLELFENNKNWASHYSAANSNDHERFSVVNSPDILFIGCCDNRIPASTLMGIDPGKVIVHRNIGNQVISIDANSMAVIHYAIEHLKVKRIIVCGHYDCGCIKTAINPKDYGTLNSWLKSIRDVYKEHKVELNEIADKGKRLDRLSELNVLEQCGNIAKTAVVQNNFNDSGIPQVHGWIFNAYDGTIKDLGFDFSGTIDKIQQIYSQTSESFFDAE
ncbi:MAG TPA: carbonic anhydrase [Saprospiraceae bacterium]|nr:carbonic anhydrase [Saprospiraceae bacterium]